MHNVILVPRMTLCMNAQLLNFIRVTFWENYRIVLKDETGLKSKLNESTLILIGSNVRNWQRHIYKREITLSLQKKEL